MQNMLMRTQAYDYDIVWKPGKQQLIADTLSRAVDPTSQHEGEETTLTVASLSTYLPMTHERLATPKNDTQQDIQLNMLKETIITGWPEQKKEVNSLLMPYYLYADERSVQDGIIFKGECVVILQAMRGDMRKEIHAAHLGINGCLRRARETLFWRGMSDDIKNYINSCETCRKYEISNPKEPLMSHEPKFALGESRCGHI